MLGLGVSRQVLAQSFVGSSSLRLLRKLCLARALPQPESGAARAWLVQHAGVAQLRCAVGCAECAHTGYRGRMPVL